jgi:hypothetical protein
MASCNVLKVPLANGQVEIKNRYSKEAFDKLTF